MTIQRAWIGFWALAVIWGSSFLFIRIGVEHTRLLTGAVMIVGSIGMCSATRE